MRITRPLILLCFFVSGATSLAFEIAWAKELSYILGNSLYGAATVISSFMAGLALGSFLAGRRFLENRNPLALYAMAQGAIALLGFFSIDLLRLTPPLFGLVYTGQVPSVTLSLALRFLIVFLFLLVPAALMGLSLPLLVEARKRGSVSLGSNFGLLYGLNTLGAVSGTLIAGYHLMPRYGITSSCRITAAADLAVALVTLVLFLTDRDRHTARTAATASRQDAATSKQKLLAILFLFSGALALVYEVAWFRLLGNILGSTVHAFTNMLATFLVGVGLGSVAGSWLVKRFRVVTVWVVVFELSLAFAALLPLYWVNDLPDTYARLFWSLGQGQAGVGYILAQFAVTSILVLPATLFMGLLFPFVAQMYRELGPSDAPRKTASEVYTVNTVGGILGSILAGFVLVPGIGVRRTMLLATLAGVGLGLVTFWLFLRVRALPRLVTWVAVMLGLAALLYGLPRVDPLRVSSGRYMQMTSRQIVNNLERLKEIEPRLLYAEEGMNGTITLSTQSEGAGELVLRISGKVVASTAPTEREHLTMLGQFPLLYLETPRDVMVIGFGTGLTTGSVLSDSRVERASVIEIEPRVIEAAEYFELINGDPLNDPRTHLIVDDGRTYLTYGRKTYDLITIDPISPLVAGSASLYNREFYEIAAARLEPGGVFCQWIPMRWMSTPLFKGILRAMRGAFDHFVVHAEGSNAVVIASNAILELDLPTLEKRIAEVGNLELLTHDRLTDAYDFVRTIQGGERELDRFLADGDRVTTDDNLWLEFRAPFDYYEPSRLLEEFYVGFAATRISAIDSLVRGLTLETLVREVVSHPPFKMEAAAGVVPAGVVQDLRENFGVDLSQAIEEAFSARFRVSEVEQRIELLRRREILARDNDERIEVAREILSMPHADGRAETGLKLLRLLKQERRYEEAAELARRLQLESPGLIEAFTIAVEIALLRDEPERAQEIAERGLLFDPDEPYLRRIGRKSGPVAAR